DSLPAVLRSLNERQEVPAGIAVDGLEVAPADYLAAAARALRALLESGEPPGSLRIVPTVCRSEEQVDQQAAESGWRSVMLPPGFAAPNLVELARLGAWTLKPAVLCA
ncbi:MAG: hypothetical protein HUU35_18020, partial [Armatimonadetes bacterium]|nr:hypothetical protein [Armatimonadota bacterium]